MSCPGICRRSCKPHSQGWPEGEIPILQTLETVRRIGSDRWLTELQVFELDVNGRMSLIATESEETSGK
jgi:hypothetical protein